MGLDIKAVSRLRLVPDVSYDSFEYEDDDTLVWLYNMEAFKDRSDFPEGVYRRKGYAPVASWSYIGYGDWRRRLCRDTIGVAIETVWAHPDQFEDEPFFELIHFADNEGHLGTATCRRLLDAFESHPEVGGTEREAFIRGLKLACDGGALVFT